MFSICCIVAAAPYVLYRFMKISFPLFIRSLTTIVGFGFNCACFVVRTSNRLPTRSDGQVVWDCEMHFSLDQYENLTQNIFP